MITPKITNMTPAQIMVKRPFTRLLPPDAIPADGSYYARGNTLNAAGQPVLNPPCEIITPLDCMREFDMNAHKILSRTYYPNPISKEVDSEGNERYYERKLARVTVDLIQMFHVQRTSLLTGSSTDLRIVNRNANSEERSKFSVFREGWELKNMETAKFELISRAGKTMDSAIVGYMDNGTFGWRAFSYENGDTCYEHKNPFTGRTGLFGRHYFSVGAGDTEATEYLDVWDDSDYMRYRRVKEGEKVGTDGWVVDQAPEKHGFSFCPVAYIRLDGPFWGSAIRPIDEMEKDLSQLLENNKLYGLRVLVALGSDMEVKASFDGRPLQINGPSDGKVNYLEPADASDSFMLSISNLEQQAYIAANCVKQTELKSGADISSLTVKMLNQPAYRKAILDTFVFQSTIDKMVEIYREGYAMELKRVSDFVNFRVKARTYPYVMMSENEEVSNLVQLSTAGVLSKQSGAEEAYNLGYGGVDEYSRILQEEHDALLGQQNNNNNGNGGESGLNAVNAARQALANS